MKTLLLNSQFDFDILIVEGTKKGNLRAEPVDSELPVTEFRQKDYT